MQLDETCSHIENLKKYLDRHGLFIVGEMHDVYIECDRCEMDILVTDLYAEEFDDEELDAEEENDLDD